MLLTGDSGGGLDPCLGMGISLALMTAGFAARCVVDILVDPHGRENHLRGYDRACRQLFRHYRGFDTGF